MPKRLVSLWALLLAAPTSITAASIRPERLFSRADTCAVGFTQCSGAGLPANFCCQKDSICNVLAGGTTVLCCPSGEDCFKLAPITCDITQQNASLHSDSPVKTTALRGTLKTCGDGCCPFGYSCTVSGKCQRDENQSVAPIESGIPVSTSAPAATSTAAPGSSPTGTTSSVESPDPESEKKGPNPETIAGGVIGGVIAVVLIVAGCVLFRRRKQKAASVIHHKNRSTSSFGNIISNPVTISSPKLASEGRTDFIRKSPLSTATTARDSGRFASPGFPQRPGTGSSERTLHNANLPQTPASVHSRNSVAVAPIRAMRAAPVTPRAQRQPSVEIDVWADPSTVGRSRRDSDSRKTTFTEMLEAADLGELGRGGRYVPPTPPAYNTPPSRQ
jgi:hypothetical protein